PSTIFPVIKETSRSVERPPIMIATLIWPRFFRTSFFIDGPSSSALSPPELRDEPLAHFSDVSRTQCQHRLTRLELARQQVSHTLLRTDLPHLLIRVSLAHRRGQRLGRYPGRGQ